MCTGIRFTDAEGNLFFGRNLDWSSSYGEGANVSRLFHTLLGVSMVKGGAKMGNGDFEYTVYTGGYSAATKTYYASGYDDPSIRSFPMDDAGLDGGRVVPCH